jgi:hypothetical protein
MGWITPRVGLVALLWGCTAAADPCFCLQDTADRLWYDCIEYRKGPGPDPFYDCLPSTKARDASRWRRATP